jgi:hypothetical protein
MKGSEQPNSSRLDELVQQLPRNVVPQRDLWAGIAHAITAPPGRNHSHHVAFAASILLVLGASLYFGQRQPVFDATSAITPAYLSEMQQNHRENVQNLMIEYSEQQAWYPDWEQQLQELQQAENAIYNALHDNPDNRELLALLRGVQEKQLKLIDAVYRPQLNPI